MLNPLSQILEKELTDSQKNVIVEIAEQEKIISLPVTNYPSNLILEPSGRALVKLDNAKTKVNNVYEIMGILQDVVNMATTTLKPSWLNNDRLLIQRPVINVESEQPAIVFNVTDGKPGAAGSGPINAPSRRMVTPILIGRYIDPKDDSSEVYLYGQRLDYNISISVYGKTAHEADILKEWVADIIKVYLWYVRYSGVLDFTFIEDLGDSVEALRHKRTLKYGVSIEKLNWSNTYILKQISLQISTSS
jgi:hypothetical protein